MDIRIKGSRDGIETARILKTRYDVPLVYLTAHADEATIERAKTTEPSGYLLKPVKPAELRGVLEISFHRHVVERRVRERERWSSATLRSISDAIVVVDLVGSLTFMNAEAEALVGVTFHEAKDRPVRDVIKLVREDGADDDLPISRALAEGCAVELSEVTLLNASSGACWVVTLNAVPLRDGGQILGAVMIIRDVTETKRVRRRLDLADRLASLGTMAGGLAHQVNNPLSVVTVNSEYLAHELGAIRSEVLAGGALSPEGEDRLQGTLQVVEDMKSAALRIGRVVSDLGKFSRHRSPTGDRADVVRCVEWALRTTSHEGLDRARLITKLDPVPLVQADETRLGQVFINLLMNAFQSIAPGNPSGNQVSVEARTDGLGRVVVEVRDTGGGISDDALGQIFDPFFTTRPIGVGTGLGLSICHGIVASSGGEIQVDSEVGRGTTVRVSLPLGSPHGIIPSSRSALAGVRARILVVETDDPVDRTTGPDPEE